VAQRVGRGIALLFHGLITGTGSLNPLLSVESVRFVEGSDGLKLVSWFMMEGKL
jgi:hypothetical protein